MKYTKNKLEIIYEYLMITIGVIVASFSLDVFMIPNGIIDGGVTGISIMISTLSGVKLSLVVIVLNIPFFILGYFQLGKRFITRVSFAITLFSILLEVFKTLPSLNIDMILAAVFGGMMLGVGVGFVIRYGGCLDGTETVAILISRRTELSVGNVVLMANLIIYVTSAFVFGWERALYSLMSYFITFPVIDKVAEGFEQGKAAMIITKNGKNIAETIYNKLGRTITYWDGSGLVNGSTKIMYVVVTRMEISELKKIVDEDETSAFMTIMDVADIVGNHVKKTKKNLVKERRKERIESGQMLIVEELMKES